MRTSVRLAGTTGAVVLSLSLAACGGSSSSTASMPGMNNPASAPATSPATETSTDARHNDADISFARTMIAHHQDAIAMAKLAPNRASSPHVKDLAARIETAQSPEITQMTSWLTAWGQPVTQDSMSATGMGSGGAMGMMSPTQMKQLKAATGKDFDRMFLQMMTIHHKGAIAMSTSEQGAGSNPPAIALATSIQTSQSAEVTQMSTMLQNL